MRNFKFLFLAILAIAFVACNDDGLKDEDIVDNSKGKEIVDVAEGTYLGTVSVNQNDGTFYNRDNVAVEVAKTGDNTMTLIMKKVKFAERMPELDITIVGITTESTATEVLITGENLIPIAMGGEFPQYTITGLEGKVTNDSIRFSMMCGTYPLTYSGTTPE